MNGWMDLYLDLLLEVIAKTDVITLMMKKRVNFLGEYSLVKSKAKNPPYRIKL